jgi:hypothetical protein
LRRRDEGQDDRIREQTSFGELVRALRADEFDEKEQEAKVKVLAAAEERSALEEERAASEGGFVNTENEPAGDHE